MVIDWLYHAHLVTMNQVSWTFVKTEMYFTHVHRLLALLLL